MNADDCEIPPLLADKKHADFAADYEAALAEVVQVVFSYAKVIKHSAFTNVFELTMVPPLDCSRVGRDANATTAQRTVPEPKMCS